MAEQDKDDGARVLLEVLKILQPIGANARARIVAAAAAFFGVDLRIEVAEVSDDE